MGIPEGSVEIMREMEAGTEADVKDEDVDEVGVSG